MAKYIVLEEGVEFHHAEADNAATAVRLARASAKFRAAERLYGFEAVFQVIEIPEALLKDYADGNLYVCMGCHTLVTGEECSDCADCETAFCHLCWPKHVVNEPSYQ